jgi:hypothetical protein
MSSSLRDTESIFIVEGGREHIQSFASVFPSSGGDAFGAAAGVATHTLLELPGIRNALAFRNGHLIYLLFSDAAKARRLRLER